MLDVQLVGCAELAEDTEDTASRRAARALAPVLVAADSIFSTRHCAYNQVKQGESQRRTSCLWDVD